CVGYYELLKRHCNIRLLQPGRGFVFVLQSVGDGPTKPSATRPCPANALQFLSRSTSAANSSLSSASASSFSAGDFSSSSPRSTAAYHSRTSASVLAWRTLLIVNLPA